MPTLSEKIQGAATYIGWVPTVLAAAVAVLTAGSALMSDLAPAAVWTLALMAGAIPIVAWNSVVQLHEWVVRRRRAARTSAEVEGDLYGWLKKHHFYATEAVDKEPFLDFKIGVHDSTGFNFTIIKETKGSWITVFADVRVIHEPDVEMILGGGRRFLSDAIVHLSQLGTEYLISGGAPPNTKIMILVHLMIDESLTDLALLGAIRKVKSGWNIVNALLPDVKKITGATPPTPNREAPLPLKPAP